MNNIYVHGLRKFLAFSTFSPLCCCCCFGGFLLLLCLLFFLRAIKHDEFKVLQLKQLMQMSNTVARTSDPFPKTAQVSVGMWTISVQLSYGLIRLFYDSPCEIIRQNYAKLYVHISWKQKTVNSWDGQQNCAENRLKKFLVWLLSFCHIFIFNKSLHYDYRFLLKIKIWQKDTTMAR